MFMTLLMLLLGLKKKDLLLWEKTFKVQAFLLLVNFLFFDQKKVLNIFSTINK